MDKICAFCMALRPVVYCKADAAYLCLSCDAKVHSANALSGRHPRTVVCESCRYRPAYVRCADHQMLMCRACDHGQHDISSEHQKRVISSYLGCPSAKDLAAMWGFNLNKVDDNAVQENFDSMLSVSVDLDIPKQSCTQISGYSLPSDVNSVSSIFGEKFGVGSSSEHAMACNKGKQLENACYILQQILDLKKLQLTECKDNLSLTYSQEQSDVCPSKDYTLWKLDRNLDQHLRHSLSLDSDLQHMGSPYQEPNVEPFSMPFSQLDHFTSSSSVGNPLNGDSFLQSRSPVQSGQLWSQNMQDLGVCEELGFYDLSIPDVDLTFRNFEELFGCEQELTTALLDDKDMTCSSLEQHTFFERSDDDYARAMEDMSVASSACNTHSPHVNKDIGTFDQTRYCSTNQDRRCPIRPSHSTLSFSRSRLSAESCGTDCMDSGLSPLAVRQEPSYNSFDLESTKSEANENDMTRYKEKKKVKVQGYEKRIRYASRKVKADIRKRAKGRFTKVEDYESDAVNVTRSY